jgi:hypothetical protein
MQAGPLTLFNRTALLRSRSVGADRRHPDQDTRPFELWKDGRRELGQLATAN